MPLLPGGSFPKLFTAEKLRQFLHLMVFYIKRKVSLIRRLERFYRYGRHTGFVAQRGGETGQFNFFDIGVGDRNAVVFKATSKPEDDALRAHFDVAVNFVARLVGNRHHCIWRAFER